LNGNGIDPRAIDLEAVDCFWRDRHLPDALRAVAQLLETALSAATAPTSASNEQSYEVQWRLARLRHFQAMLAAEDGSPDQALQHLMAGAQHGSAAFRLQALRVEGHFWYGVNALETAQQRGKLAALAALRDTSQHIERSMTIDEEYHFAGPVRVWGRITHQKPLLLGGSLDRALEIYRRALQIAPDNSTTNLYYAEALWADQQRRAAREVLHKIITDPDDPEWRWEQARDRRLAQALYQSP
jgi:tetratricopeptide (TPR) repeat protein